MYNYSESFAEQQENYEGEFSYTFYRVFYDPIAFKPKYIILEMVWFGELDKFPHWGKLFGDNCNNVRIVKKRIKRIRNERPEKRTRREAS
jgi:hypothetical protein